MESPGSIIRQARKEQGVSLDAIAKTTRISRTNLVNIEQDDFEELPAEVFVRGFLRNVARELGIPNDTIIRSYEAFTGRVRQAALDLTPTERSTGVPAPTPKLMRAPEAMRSMTMPNMDRVTNFIGSTKPAYLIGTMAVMLGIAMTIALYTTSFSSQPAPAASSASWDADSDNPQAAWILNGEATPAPRHDGEASNESK